MPVLRAVDQNGAPMAGAKLQFYVTGTTTPTNVYSAANLSTPLSNPVAADAGGLFAPIYLDPSVTYRCQLMSAAGVLIRDIDPLGGPLALAAGSISAVMLAAGAALANLGYAPLNKAGDTATNLLLSNTAWAVNSAGYLGLPVNEQDGNYTLAAADAGKLVRANIAGAAACTIPPNTFLPGTAISLRNAATSAGVLTITRGTGVTLFGAGGATSKDWALAAGGLATIVAETTNTWVVSGAGLS